MNRADRIISILNKAFNPSHIKLQDDSAKHAGHSGSQPGGETHYSLYIESKQFAGKSKVQCHQIIYGLLTDEFNTGLHALAIDARTGS